MPGFLPNDELVIKGWLLGCGAGLVDGQVATTMPDADNWIDHLFVQIMQVGGSPVVDLPIMAPVASINVFARVPGSTKPPWGKANNVAMNIWQATHEQYTKLRSDPAVLVALPANYQAAIVKATTALSIPRRIPSDPSQYAAFSLDVQIAWVPDELVITS